MGKARSKATAENSHIGHCTHTLQSTNAKLQYSIFNTANSVICTMNCNYRIAATLYCLETWFVAGM